MIPDRTDENGSVRKRISEHGTEFGGGITKGSGLERERDQQRPMEFAVNVHRTIGARGADGCGKKGSLTSWRLRRFFSEKQRQPRGGECLIEIRVFCSYISSLWDLTALTLQRMSPSSSSNSRRLCK